MTLSTTRGFSADRCISLATLLASSLLFPLTAVAQNIITTVAGGGANSSVATTAIIASPTSVAVDTQGNVFFTAVEMNQVFKVSPGGTLTLVAGNGAYGVGGDGGAATSAGLAQPRGVAVDSSGNLFIADTNNNRIRRVAASTGIISTLAGSGSFGFSGDGGAATSASLESPTGVAVDGSGNLFIADEGNSRIRRVASATGIITTVAGDGTAGFSGDGGPATNAALNNPWGVAVDSSGDLFIADSFNNRVRLVAAATGVITTVAGDGTVGFSGDSGPATSASLAEPWGVAVDSSGNLFIADKNNGRIRLVTAATAVITTVAGNGAAGLSGDGGAATSASLNGPNAVAVDSSGDLFIADAFNNRVRFVAAATGIITTVAGGGSGGDGGPATSALLVLPHAVAADSSANLYIADTYDNRVRRVAAATGIITTLVGNGTYGSGGDGGAASSATLSLPMGVGVDSSGNLFIADRLTCRVRRVAAATGVITPVAGIGSPGYGGDGGAATNASLDNPFGIAVDSSGNLFIADTYNNRIRLVAAATGVITTVAGNGTTGFSGDGGAATSASLNTPYGIAVDGSGNLFIADSGNNRIRRVNAATGIITTVAGNGAASFSGDGGAATSASLNDPWGVAVDGSGNLFIADTSNGVIRSVDAATGVITTVAGNGGRGFGGDGGAATSATLYGPYAVAVVGSDNLLVADTYNNRIRQITATPAATLTAVLSSANPSVLGQSVTFTATVTPQSLGTPTGAVTFNDGTTAICSAAPLSSSQATCATAGLAVGTHSITAVYSGDFNFQGSTSPALTQAVVSPLVTLASISPGTAVAGATVSVTLTGANFVPGAVVHVSNSGVGVSNMNVVSTTQITAMFTIASTAAYGPANVTVTTVGGTSGPVTFAILPPISLTGLSATTSPTQPTSVGVALSSPASAELTGTLTLSFTPDPKVTNVPSGYSDPALQFASGGMTMNFTIAANATTATLPQNGAIQQGTVAGTITVTITQLSANGASVLPQPPPSLSVAVSLLAPVIASGSVKITNLSSTGFDVELDAYSTSRDLAGSSFSFQATSGTQLSGTTSFSVPLSNIAPGWFSSTSGLQSGGSFHLIVPFTFSGDTSVFGSNSVTVTLTNSVGTSSPGTGGV
jgi:sugar lactone lactonase YvrE